MDLASTLQQLYAEKAKMERAIAALEELQAASVSDLFQSLGVKRRDPTRSAYTPAIGHRARTRARRR